MRPIRRAHTNLIATCLVVLTSACGDSVTSPVPTRPTPQRPAPTFPVVTVAGQVTDPFGSPVAADVLVYPLRMSEAWYGPWGRRGQSDASGRYRIPDAPEHHDTVFVRAWRDGYVQQCATTAVLAEDTNADVILTGRADVVVAGLPDLPNTRQISGTVYSLKDNARQPVVGVSVGWEPIMDTVVADTVTDMQGRYRLRGLPRDRVNALYALRPTTRDPVYVDVAPGGDAVIDFLVP
jgi:hypothetical protein